MSAKSNSVLVDLFVAHVFDGNADGAVGAYADADTGDKSRMRSTLTALVADANRAVTADNMAEQFAIIQGYLAIQDRMKSEKAASAPVDWNVRVATRAYVLAEASRMILSGSLRPVSVPDDVELDYAQVGATYDALFGAADRDVIALADKVAVQPIGGSRSTGGDMKAHIVEALLNANGATLASSVIQHAETAAYPNGAPSSGAVSAALESDSAASVEWRQVNGITVTSDPRGAFIAK